MTGFAIELVPTAYRATVSALRYVTSMLFAALSILLEGVFYDYFHAHGPAVVSVSLGAVLVTVIAIFFLPEPAGRALEEISGAPEATLS